MYRHFLRNYIDQTFTINCKIYITQYESLFFALKLKYFKIQLNNEYSKCACFYADLTSYLNSDKSIGEHNTFARTVMSI